MKNIALMFVLCAVILSGCKSDFIENEGTHDVVIFFSAKSLTSSLIKSSSASPEEKSIEKIIIFGVDNNGDVLQSFLIQTPSLSGQVIDDVSRRVRLFYAVANPSDEVEIAEPENVTELLELTGDFSVAPQSPFMMSGIGTITGSAASIELVRTVAKIDVIGSNGLEINSVTVENTPAQGYVFSRANISAPSGSGMTSYQATVNSDGVYTIYVAENSMQTPTQFVMTGQLENQQVTYMFTLRLGDEDVDVRRNTSYQVGVSPITHSKASFSFSIPEWDGVNIVYEPDLLPRPNPYKDGIKILAIGNSFSEDVMLYLYDLLKQLGIDEANNDNIKLVSAAIGGGSLQNHADNVKSGDYSSLIRQTFLANGVKNGAAFGQFTLKEIIEQEEWDVITLQQVSWFSGNSFTYDPYLGDLIDFVQSNATNPNFKLGWHMTWAWGSNHSGFPSSHLNQRAMYEAICAAIQGKIVSNSAFDFVIPVGTAIQNARGLFGDILNPDETHLGNLGSYIGGAMWVKTITGFDISNLQTGYVADKSLWDYQNSVPPVTIDQTKLAGIVQSVNAAAVNPFESLY